MSLQPSIRCRQISEADRPAIADLLARGFPGRSRAYWSGGLERLGRSDTPAGFPKFGYLLENDGQVVGAILLICKSIVTAGESFVRCNLSSWYVEPAFRSHASMLSMVPLRHKTATFLNISPAPNTWPTIEAQGFVRYTAGQLFTIPALARGGRGLTVERFRADAPRHHLPAPEAELLAEHDRLGCITLVGTSPEGRHPFAFLPFRAKQGKLRLPGVQLVYCRSTDEFTRFAGPLGRHLLRHGSPIVILDAEGPMAGLSGYFWKDRARKYFKGAHRPALGDLAYTEFVMFGP